MERVDVLIVGGGMIGLSLAAALGDSDLRVMILDQGSKPEVDPPEPKHKDRWILRSGIRPRVTTIAKAQWNFLTRIGASVSAPAYSRIEVWDGEGTGTVSFSAEDGGSADVGLFEASIERAWWTESKGDDRAPRAPGRGPGPGGHDARRGAAVPGLRG